MNTTNNINDKSQVCARLSAEQENIEMISSGDDTVFTCDCFYKRQVPTLRTLALAALDNKQAIDLWDSNEEFWYRLTRGELSSNFYFYFKNYYTFQVDDTLRMPNEFTLDWFHDMVEHHNRCSEGENFIVYVSQNFFFYLAAYRFDYAYILDSNPSKLPWAQPNLSQFFLMVSGDIESNPGPQVDYKTLVYKKILELQQLRKRQDKVRSTRLRTKLEYKNHLNNFRWEMFGDYSPFSGVNKACDAATSLADMCRERLPELSSQCSNLTEIATSVLERIHSLTSKMSESNGILNTMSQFFRAGASTMEVLPALISILICLSAMAWDWKMGCVAIMLVILYFKWPMIVVNKVKDIISQVGAIGYPMQFQMNLNDHVPIIGQVVFTLLAYFGVSKIPASRTYDNLIKRMDQIPKAVVGASKMWDASGKIFETVSDEFKVFFLGEKRADLMAAKGLAGEVENWVNRVQFYTEAKQKNLLARDEASVREVETLFYQMYRWKHTPQLWKSLSIDAQRVISSAAPIIQELFKFACRSTVHEGGPRKAPLCVLFSGSSGQGKSEILYPLAMSLLAHRGCDMSNARNEIYVRNYETEYWDGYVAQKIALFDDAFQMKDTPGNPSPEFMEAIRLINTAPAHVHGADLNDKGRFFSSEICIYTTNLFSDIKSYITSINCPDAAIRRLNANAYKIYANPAYCTIHSENKEEKNKTPTIDKKKIDNCEACKQLMIEKGITKKFPFCPHAQCFTRYNMLTDEELETNMTYSQVVKQIKEYDVQMSEREGDKLEMFDFLQVNPYAFEINLHDPSSKILFTKPSEWTRPLAEEGDPEVPSQMEIETLTPTEEGVTRRKSYVSEFFDCVEHVENADSTPTQSADIKDGVLDLSNALDMIAYKDLLCFTVRATKRFCTGDGVDMDFLEAEIALHPNLYSTWKRLRECGFKNRDIQDTSLLDLMDEYNIAYNPTTKKYVSLNDWSISWKRVCTGFKSYVKKLTDQICKLWETSHIGSILSLLNVGLILIGMTKMVYDMTTTSYMCPVCKIKECVCVRLVAGGLTYKDEFYPDEEEEYAPESAYDGLPRTSRPKVESNDRLSGHARTLRQKVESDTRVSGQPRTARMLIESDTRISGQPKTSRMKVESYFDQGCEAIETRVCNNSMYLMHDDIKPLGNVIFIKGTCFLINYHYIELLKVRAEKSTPLYFSNRAGRLIETTFGQILNNYVRLQKDKRDIDAAIVYLDGIKNKVHIHPNLIKHFIDKTDLKNLTGSYRAQMPTYNSRITDVCLSKRSLVDVHMNNNEEVIDDRGTKISINHSWKYDGSTTPGDCGAPIILNNPSCLRKIVGIHMASDRITGLAQTITQESLLDALSRVPVKYQACVEFDLPLKKLSTVDDLCGSVPLTSGLVVHGEVDQVVSSGSNTKIIPSKFFDIVPHKTIPAQLYASSEHNPMLIGLKKYGKEVPRIDPNLIHLATIDVANNFTLNVCRKNIDDYRRVLDYQEAVMGVEGEEFLAPINRSTSMGFPYALQTDKPGKREAFGFDEWNLDTPLALEIEEDVNALIENCRQGIQTGVYWSDTLKDERRPIEKVLAGKTRVFCGGPVHFTIAFRQYFLGFAAWMMHNRNQNEVSVGTNVYSNDWNDIVEKLATRARSKTGLNIVAGDFANFDGSLSSQILWAILDEINEWYDDGEENKAIRRTMWTHIVHAIHINRTVVYQATHSQPSGCPITAILNSIYNSIIIRIAYLICARKYFKESGFNYATMTQFNEYVAMCSYGDDNLIGICEAILAWFNQVTITEALRVIGHEYTDEAKSGTIVPIRDISEVAYLKRSFKWNALLNRYVAPLDLAVVMEIVQWTKKGTLEDAITLANLDVTMRELSLHDEEIFNKYKRVLSEACKKNKINYRFCTQLEYLGLVCEEPMLYEAAGSYTLCKSNRPLARNYIQVDKKNKCMYVGDYDHDTLKNKLMSICHYRNIQLDHVVGLPTTLIRSVCDAPIEETIVQCISADARMSAGLAKQIQEQYHIRDDLPPLKKHDVIYLNSGRRRICCLVTKKQYHDKPTLEDIRICLDKMDIQEEYAFPRIGCGLDKLEWDDVLPLLHRFPNKTFY